MQAKINTNILNKLKQLAIYNDISEIYIKDGRAFCCIEMPCEISENLNKWQAEIEDILSNIDGVKHATVSFTGRRTTQAAPIQAPPVQQKTPAPLAKEAPEIKQVIAVASGKGGVGKSSCAVGLAKALRALDLRVGLLDLDVYGPSIPYLMKAENKQPIIEEENGEKLILPLELEGIKLLSIGFFVKTEAAVAWRGHMASSFVKQMLHKVKWGALDVLLIDMPPGTGDIQLTLAQNIKLSGAIVVSTPHELALLDVRRCIDMFNKLKVRIFGLIENMSFFQAGAEIYHVFGKNGAFREAEKLGLPVLGQLPIKSDLTSEYRKIAQILSEEFSHE